MKGFKRIQTFTLLLVLVIFCAGEACGSWKKEQIVESSANLLVSSNTITNLTKKLIKGTSCKKHRRGKRRKRYRRCLRAKSDVIKHVKQYSKTIQGLIKYAKEERSLIETAMYALDERDEGFNSFSKSATLTSFGKDLSRECPQYGQHNSIILFVNAGKLMALQESIFHEAVVHIDKASVIQKIANLGTVIAGYNAAFLAALQEQADLNKLFHDNNKMIQKGLENLKIAPGQALLSHISNGVTYNQERISILRKSQNLKKSVDRHYFSCKDKKLFFTPQNRSASALYMSNQLHLYKEQLQNKLQSLNETESTNQLPAYCFVGKRGLLKFNNNCKCRLNENCFEPQLTKLVDKSVHSGKMSLLVAANKLLLNTIKALYQGKWGRIKRRSNHKTVKHYLRENKNFNEKFITELFSSIKRVESDEKKRSIASTPAASEDVVDTSIYQRSKRFSIPNVRATKNQRFFEIIVEKYSK